MLQLLSNAEKSKPDHPGIFLSDFDRFESDAIVLDNDVDLILILVDRNPDLLGSRMLDNIIEQFPRDAI